MSLCYVEQFSCLHLSFLSLVKQIVVSDVYKTKLEWFEVKKKIVLK